MTNMLKVLTDINELIDAYDCFNNLIFFFWFCCETARRAELKLLNST